MNQYQPWGLLVGRVLLAYMFVMGGIHKITNFAGSAKYMASKGMILIEPLLAGATALELAGGLMLALGWKTRWAALAIFLYIIPLQLIFHAFWSVPPEQVGLQTVLFNKNLAIMGGLLFVAFMGPGRMSLDKS